LKPNRNIPSLIARTPDLEPSISSYGSEDGEPSGRSKTEWLQIFWQQRQFLKRLTIRGLLAVTLLAFLIPKRYESTTRIMPPDSESSPGMGMLAALAGRGGGSSDSGLASSAASMPGLGMLASDLLGAKSTGATLAGILKSDTIRDRLIDRFNLQKAYWDRYKQDARTDLGKFTEIVEDRKSGIITVTVTDRNPQRASALAKAYVDELDRLVAELSTSAARRERMFIEQRLQTVQQELDTSARQFSEYASKNTAVDIGAQTKAMVESAAVLQGQLIAARSELQGLEQIYTNNNIRVRTVQARIGELQKQLVTMGGQGPPVPGAAPSTEAASPELYPSIRQLPLLGVRWADLYRQTKINETVFELLRQKYELARIQEAKEIPTIKVLDPPLLPEKKTSPHRILIILSGTLLVFVFGCAWIVSTFVWKEMSSEDLRKQLAQEVGQKCREKGLRFYRLAQQRFSSNGHNHNGKGSTDNHDSSL
jgi:capsule polysaccharide export protein KpsE/RkpR